MSVQEEIEKMEKKMEMGGEAGPKQTLHTLLQRQNKFLDSCRETKVSANAEKDHFKKPNNIDLTHA